MGNEKDRIFEDVAEDQIRIDAFRKMKKYFSTYNVEDVLESYNINRPINHPLI